MPNTLQNNLDTKRGMILQSYGDSKTKGCEYCNESNPDYINVNGIKTLGESHYISIDYQTEDENGISWNFYELEVDYCPWCGKKLFNYAE